ncbi:PREDICTED: trihelix transcription factor GTL2-like isoform X2 [Lupinus angustifolius]|uniref:trihelix transcription factor GTL2-like isoform X2 n=1 Tax=Lupinus angustifolius TaxID=3871 RepID=UPI00092E4EB3|nr:PREDICTED: trihelix transcription factor GTL2-like isoform X2 [Lupinus angustifolius]
MFDGVPDQFHQFITPMTSLPLHLPFPLHSSAVVAAAPNNTTFPSFDPYNPSPHQLPLQHQPNLLHQLHQPSTHKEHEPEKEQHNTLPMNFEIERDQSIDPWTNDEVLALLRIRSSMENWFPELTWEHVSRKLAELGYKRTSEKCKEKFEEESRYFNNISYTKNNNNYRFLNEIEELYNHGDNHQVAETVKPTSIEEGKDKIMDLEEGLSKQNEQGDNEEEMVGENAKEDKRPKRKRPDRFEMFKGFCESIVHKMMEQQEEMHNKLIKDMMKRDEEKFAREEAWKKQEMDRMNQDLEIIAQEKAIAGDRQANIIEFLNKFSATASSHNSTQIKVTNVSNPNICTTPSSPSSQNPNPNMVLENSSSIPSQETLQNASSTTSPTTLQNPSSSSLKRQNNTISVSNKYFSNVICTSEKDGVGRRWPKDEVLAMINLRCSSLNNNNNNNEEKEGNKPPLWERISQGMLELGYERSAKRCKEKWENINKYFKKTKDVNKKRSLDSRTCPYFHQLNNLYNQGRLVLHSEKPENELSSQANNQSQLAEPSLQVESGGFSMQQQQQQVDHHGGEKTLVQVTSLDFDQF